MSTPEDILIDIVRNGTAEEIVSYVKKLDAKTKKRISEAAETEFRLTSHLQATGKHNVPYADKSCKNSNETRCNLIRIATLGCSSLSQYKKVHWDLIPMGEDLAFAVSEFAPEWVHEWAENILGDHTFRFWDIRSLVHKGLCEKPSNTNYTLAFIDSGYRLRSYKSTCEHGVTEQADRLQEMPDIMEGLIWSLFEVEGGGEVSLAAIDKYSGCGIWNSTLIELSSRGVLSRNRLLDESLHALGRGFAQFRANWYSNFHTTLAPTLVEREARSEQYLQLLSSNSAHTVSFAIKSLKILAAEDRLDPESLIKYVRPAMQAKAKSTVKLGIQLIEYAIKQSPAQVSNALPIITDALIHESADIQKLVIRFLSRYKAQLSGEIVDELHLYSDSIAATLRTDFESLIGAKIEIARTDNTTQEGVKTTMLSPEPNFSACLHSYLAILENSDSPIAIEILLDGLCRLSSTRTPEDNELLGALRKRAGAISKVEPRFVDYDGEHDLIRIHLARLAISLVELWTAKDQSISSQVSLLPMSGRLEYAWPRFDDLFHIRNEWVFKIIKYNLCIPLLSTPTDSRSYIDGNALIERLALYTERNVNPNETDLAMAMMRLNPSDRVNVCIKLKKTSLVNKLVKDTDSPPTEYHIKLDSDLGTFHNLRSMNGIREKNYKSYPIDLFRIVDENKSLYPLFSGPVNTNRWYATIWPTNPEAFYANALHVFDSVQNLANSPYQAFFETMLNEDFCPEEFGIALLLMGLVGHDPSIRTLAIDAFIPAAQRGALDNKAMGIAASQLFPNSSPLARYTNALKEIVDIAPSLSPFVRELIAETLRFDVTSPPRGVAGLIDFLYELCLNENVTLVHTDANTFLTKLKPTSSAGKSAKKVLSLTNKCA